jgi:hypothetical protein
MPKEVSAVLRTLKNAWRDAEPNKGFEIYDDGDYLMQIAAMEVNLSKKQRIQVCTTLKFMDGKYKDKEFLKFDGIDNDVSMGWFKGFCEVIGVELPEDIENLPEVLDDFVNETQDMLNVTLRTKDGYTNAFVKGISDYSSSSEEAPPEEEEAEPEDNSAKEKGRDKSSRRDAGRSRDKSSREKARRR